MTVFRSPRKLRARGYRASNQRVLLEISRVLHQLSDQIVSDLVAERAAAKEYIEKTLHLTSVHYDLFTARSARPYFPLNDHWALTFLDTGEPFFVDTSDRDISPWVIMGGHWEPNVARSLMAYATPGMTILDVGAHMGYYTIKLAKRIGTTGRLLAFEPNPQMLPFVEENIKLNDLVATSQVCPAALGDERGKGLLKYARGRMGGGSLINQRAAPLEISVDVERLDDVVPKNWVVDLIKIDAEGYEKKILDGGQELLVRSRDCAIMLELRLESWEEFASIEALGQVCGENKTIFGVLETGELKILSICEVRPFILSKKRATGFHENYFLVAPMEAVRSKLSDLIVHQ